MCVCEGEGEGGRGLEKNTSEKGGLLNTYFSCKRGWGRGVFRNQRSGGLPI